MINKLVLFSLGVLVLIPLYAKNNKSDIAKKILFRAKNVTEKETFKSVLLRNYKGKRVERILYQTYVNGTPLIRHETIINGIMDEIIISNRSGIYYIRGDRKFAIKNEIKIPKYNPALNWNFMLNRLDWNYNCTYSMVEEKFNGIPCYKITMKSPNDEESMAKMINKPIQYIKENKNVLQRSFLALRVFWIGKKNNFIYSCAFYNSNGKRIYSKNFGEIKFLKQIDKNLFATPKKFDTVKNLEDVKKIALKYRDIIRKIK